MRKVFALLFLIPLATSCSGFPISRDEALKVINTIQKSVDSVSSTSYTSTRVNNNGSYKVTTVSMYSKEKQFFHTYTIRSESVARVEESWRFVMNYQYEVETDSGKKTESKNFIFEVTRKIREGKTNPDDGSNFDVVYELYSSATWKKYATEYEGTLKRSFTDALESSKTLIADKTNQIDLKSFNSNSLSLNCKSSTMGSTTQQAEYELNVTNGQLISINDIRSETSSIELSYKYSTGDIVYPAINTKIRL